MPSKPAKKPKGLKQRLMAVAPEYRFAVYKKLTSQQRSKKSGRGSPVLSGSFENGKRR